MLARQGRCVLTGTEERIATAIQLANDGPNRDVQVHPPGTWDGPESTDWVVWCGSMIGRAPTLDAALDVLLSELRLNCGCWYCPENYDGARAFIREVEVRADALVAAIQAERLAPAAEVLAIADVLTAKRAVLRETRGSQ